MNTDPATRRDTRPLRGDNARIAVERDLKRHFGVSDQPGNSIANDRTDTKTANPKAQRTRGVQIIRL